MDDWVKLIGPAIAVLGIVSGAAMAFGAKRARHDSLADGVASLVKSAEKLDTKLDTLSERVARLDHLPREVERLQERLSELNETVKWHDGELEFIFERTPDIHRRRRPKPG